MHAVVLHPKAQKDLKELDKQAFARITKVLQQLALEPHLGKKLLGEYAGLRSVRAVPYRVIYEVYPEKKIIHVITIGHRQGVY